jgi:hypothetical protein
MGLFFVLSSFRAFVIGLYCGVVPVFVQNAGFTPADKPSGDKSPRSSLVAMNSLHA